MINMLSSFKLLQNILTFARYTHSRRSIQAIPMNVKKVILFSKISNGLVLVYILN